MKLLSGYTVVEWIRRWFRDECYKCGTPIEAYVIPHHHGVACPSCEPWHFRAATESRRMSEKKKASLNGRRVSSTKEASPLQTPEEPRP